MIPLSYDDFHTDPVQSLEEIMDSTSKFYNPLITKLIKDEYGSIEEYMKCDSFRAQVAEYLTSKSSKR